PDTSIIRVALTAPAEATAGNFLYGGNCGLGNASQLCTEDPSYRMIRQFIANIFVDQSVLSERAPVQFVNGSYTYSDLADRVTTMLDPVGLQLNDPVMHQSSPHTGIRAHRGRKFAPARQGLAPCFGAGLVTATPTCGAPARGQERSGLVGVLRRGCGVRW